MASEMGSAHYKSGRAPAPPRVSEVLGLPLKTVKEGLAEILVPAGEVRAPRRAPVFYNPVMALNRDIAVLAVRAFYKRLKRPLKVCEPLCGCGIRGIRLALEAPGVGEVVMGDLNPRAVSLAELNIRRNGVSDKVRVMLSDANLLMSSFSGPSKRFDYVDLDPFGSPSPFLASAVRCMRNGGLLAMTATDMAPLCGIYVMACMRKYGSVPIRVGYAKELALRILVGALVRIAAAYEIGVRPILCHATDHYARAYCIIKRGTGRASESIGELGYVAHCPKCHEREVLPGLIWSGDWACPICGSKRLVAGPLWVGELFDKAFCEEMASELSDMAWIGRRTKKLIDILIEEAGGPPTYYPLARICDDLQLPIPPLRAVMEALEERGWWASKTHLDPQGIRTDAPAEELVKLLRALR